MSTIMLPPEVHATIADTLASLMNRGFNSFGFAAGSTLFDALDDCRDGYGDYSALEIYRKLYALNLAAYYDRYPQRTVSEEIPTMPQTPLIYSRLEYSNGHDLVKPWHYRFLKLLDSLIYQLDECRENPIYTGLGHLSCTLTRFIAQNSDEYAAAPWCAL